MIAIDGRTSAAPRSRSSKDCVAPHLVSACDHATGTVLGQLAVTATSNEIPAVRTVLKDFDLTGMVVTVDAMHAQTDTARLIVDAGGDDVFTVQGTSRACAPPARTCPGATCQPTT